VDAERVGGLDGLGEMMGITCSTSRSMGWQPSEASGTETSCRSGHSKRPSLKSFGLGLSVDPKMVEIDGGGAEVSVTYQGGALEGWTVVSRFHPDLPDIVVGLACRAAELQWREPLTAERLICSMTSTDQRNVTP
jgi:hypothetical protein